MGILREDSQGQMAEVAKRHGVSEASIYAWRKRFLGMNVDDVKQLRSLEIENARLKKLLAKRDLEIEVMKEICRISTLAFVYVGYAFFCGVKAFFSSINAIDYLELVRCA